MKESTSKATPRPWTRGNMVDYRTHILSKTSPIQVIARDALEENAALIVSAVNSHDKAVELARQVAAIDYKSRLLREDALDRARRLAREVLRLAGEEE